MKILNLIMQKVHFDAVRSETKKIETREIRPKNITRYCLVDAKGDYKDVITYDAIQMYNGYRKDRPGLLVEVLSAQAFITIGEDGKDIVYTENGKEYVQATIEYKLGKILDFQNS